MFKKEYRKSSALLSLKILHFILIVGTFFFAWIWFRYGEWPDTSVKGFRYNSYITIGYGAALYFLSRTYNTYLLGYSRIRTLAFSQFLAQLFSVVIIYVIASLGWAQWHNPVIFLVLLVVQFFIDVIWSYWGNWCFFKMNPAKNTVLIYRNALDKKRFGSIKGKPFSRFYHVIEEKQYDGSFRDIKVYLDGFDAVFVAGVNSRCRNGILKYCKERAIPGLFLPHVGDVIMQEARHIQSFDSPVLYVNKKEIRPEYAAGKRLFDFFAALIGLIVLSPLMLITALAIKLYDHGPVFYKQTRLTKNGRHFKIIKFRSMRVDAEKDGVARLSSGDKDDRITPVGRIVRKCRLDELPQLINILRGDMSVVGPRPERPEIAEQYYKTMPDFQLRLQVKAGLTGYAQVYGKYNTDPYEKLEFDLLYINNMGFLTDIRLIFATIGILFQPESTEGIAEGATTAMDYENEEDATEEKEMTSKHTNC